MFVYLTTHMSVLLIKFVNRAEAGCKLTKSQADWFIHRY